MPQTFFRILSVPTLLLLSFAVAYSQTEKAQISGQVSDPQGLAIPKAKLELTNLDDSTKLSGGADDVGHYSFAGLPGGRYRLSASADGFNPFTSEDIILAPVQALSFDIKLEVVQGKVSVVDVADGADAFTGCKAEGQQSSPDC